LPVMSLREYEYRSDHEENSENCNGLSKSIEKDVKEYVKRLYELKQEEWHQLELHFKTWYWEVHIYLKSSVECLNGL